MEDAKKPSRAFGFLQENDQTPISTKTRPGLSQQIVSKLAANGVKTLGHLKKLSKADINNLTWLSGTQRASVVRAREALPNKWPEELAEEMGNIFKGVGKQPPKASDEGSGTPEQTDKPK